MRCTYKIKINGKYLDINNQPTLAEDDARIFETEQELDAWLYEHRDSLVSHMDSLDIISDLNPIEETASIIINIHNNAQNDLHSPNRAAVKTIWDNISPKDIVRKKTYEQARIEKIRKTTGASQEEAERIYKEEQEANKSTKIGTIFHKILELKANNQSLDGVTAEGISLDSVDLASEREFADKFFKDLDTRFGKRGTDYEIYTERSLSSNKINDSVKSILKGIFNNFETVVGVADLVVITKNGEVHVFDYKTSKYHKPASWYNPDYNTIKAEGSYPTDVRDDYEAQVWSYAAMYKQRLSKHNVYGHIVNWHRNENDHLDAYEGITDLDFNSSIRKNLWGMFNISETLSTEGIESTNKTMTEVFGDDTPINKRSEGFKRSVDMYLNSGFIKNVDPNSEMGKKGYTLYFVNNLDNQRLVYAKNRTEMRAKVEQYVNDLNEHASTESLSFGKSLLGAMRVGTLEQLKESCRNVTTRHSDELRRVFEKYVTQHWSLIEDETLLGNGIFIFQKGDRSEIVMYETADPLTKKIDLRKGTSILGNVLRDDEHGVDNRLYLSANIGNLLLMKAVSFMANNPDFFNSKKISNICAINPIYGETFNNVPLSVLSSNWQTLSLLHKKLNLRSIADLVFNDGEAYVRQAQDYIMGIANYNTNLKIFTEAKEDADYKESQIREMINNLSWVQGEYTKASDANLKLAYGELYKALLSLRGKYWMVREPNIGKYLSSGVFFSGGYFAPFALSPSANLRIINELSIIFHNKIANEVEKIAVEWQKLYEDVVKTSALGGEYKFFMNWFEKDPNDPTRIRTDFKLKDPRFDSYFADKPEEAKMCQFFLDTIAQFRWGDRWEEYIDQPEYFEVPLCEVLNDVEIVETANNFLEGGLKAVKKRLNYFTQAVKETVVGKEFTQTLNGKRVDLGKQDIKNQFNVKEISNPFFGYTESERMEQLEDKDKGPAYFEKNLDIVFLNTVVTSMKSKLSTDFLPLFTGLRILLNIEQDFNGAQMSDIVDAVDAYVSSVIFNRSLVETTIQPLRKLLGILQGLVSKMTLGLSSKAFTREMFSSNIRTAWQAFSKDPRFSNSFDADVYEKELLNMLTNWKDAFIVNSKDMQLNTKFRGANLSYQEMAEALRSNKYGVKNITDDFWFLTSTLPDFFHRTSVLKATLIKLGAYDAYVMDDRVLKYDWTKDKRFDLLFKYSDNGKLSEQDVLKITDYDEKLAWNKQSNLYKDAIDHWKKWGENLSYGDTLPEALDPLQQLNFKTQTDILYGNYDNESKSLMQRTLLGSMFFQFKTYGISRMIEWWKMGGTVNIILPKEWRDENGKLIYVRVSTPEELMSGKPLITYITEDEITEADLNNNLVRPAQDYAGMPNEGRIQSVYAIAIAAVKGDSEAIKRLWNDPHKRANVLLAMHDTWIMVLLAGLVRLLYDDDVIETMNEQDWWTRWTHAVIMGVAQDGPVWEVAKSLWGNGEIPAMSALSKYYTTALSVINGNTYVTQGLLNSFGATREFSNIIDNL